MNPELRETLRLETLAQNRKIKPFMGFGGNPKLKPLGVKIAFTQNQVNELVKCANSPEYFIRNYVRIKTVDHGLQPFELYDRQADMLDVFHRERKVIVKASRQIGKSTTAAAYMLWYIIFNPSKTVGILANKEKTAKEILGRIKTAYQWLPPWMQQGIAEWNKNTIELENGSIVMAGSTASDAIRGFTINLLFLDEFAHVENNLAEEFFTSVYPTISSGLTSKIIIVSTPFGYNHYFRLWDEAKKKVNGFANFEFNWRDIPGRDEAWRLDQERTLGPLKYRQEVETEFLGSSLTLIAPEYIAKMSADIPVIDAETDDHLLIYAQPIENHAYVMTVDVSRGSYLDYSAFLIIDVTELPYRIVARYRDDAISPLIYPSIIAELGRRYNNAYTLVEINDIGGQVADSLFVDHEYENLFFSNIARTRAVQQVTIGSSSDAPRPGVRTTKTVKRLGCENFKTLVEGNKFIINDYNLIAEISTFTLQKDSYAADKGHHDDLVMCCVLFSWLTTQGFFIELTNSDIRNKLLKENQANLEAMTLPIFVLNNGLENKEEEKPQVVDGDLWMSGDLMMRMREMRETLNF